MTTRSGIAYIRARPRCRTENGLEPGSYSVPARSPTSLSLFIINSTKKTTKPPPRSFVQGHPAMEESNSNQVLRLQRLHSHPEGHGLTHFLRTSGNTVCATWYPWLTAPIISSHLILLISCKPEYSENGGCFKTPSIEWVARQESITRTLVTPSCHRTPECPFSALHLVSAFQPSSHRWLPEGGLLSGHCIPFFTAPVKAAVLHLFTWLFHECLSTLLDYMQGPGSVLPATTSPSTFVALGT